METRQTGHSALNIKKAPRNSTKEKKDGMTINEKELYSIARIDRNRKMRYTVCPGIYDSEKLSFPFYVTHPQNRIGVLDSGCGR